MKFFSSRHAICTLLFSVSLAACSANKINEVSYGNDALPSEEVTAFQKVDKIFKYGKARIEYDERSCAVYRGIAPDGTMKDQPLLDHSNKRICISNKTATP